MEKDYKTANEYLIALKEEIVKGQMVIVNDPDLNLQPSTAGKGAESFNTLLGSENKQLKDEIKSLQSKLDLIKKRKTDVVVNLTKRIEELQQELEDERKRANSNQVDNGLYVSLESILEWASEKHLDNKDVTMIQNMIYDRFNLTAEGKRFVRTLAVDELKKLIILHADQVVTVAENGANIVHTQSK